MTAAYTCLMRILLVLAVACGRQPPPQQPPAEEPPQASAECEHERCLNDITRMIQERRNESRACYDRGLKRQPTIEGRIIINFKIDPDGQVVETSQGLQDNQITEQGVVECVSEVIKKIRFPKSAGGKTTRAYHVFEF